MNDAELGKVIRENFCQIECFWEASFRKYLVEHNFHDCVNRLKAGLDAVSCEYIDRFFNLLELTKIKNSILVKNDYAFTSRDLQYQKDFNAYKARVKNFPYHEFGDPVKFIFSNLYGLVDVPASVIKSVNNQLVIDGGGIRR